MQSLTGAMLVCAALLVVAAVPKLVHPRPTAVALRSVGLAWVRPVHARVLALGELLIGVAALVHASRLTAAAVMVAYLAFSAFLVRALTRKDAGATCGCTGQDDTPPTIGHLVLTLSFAAITATAATTANHDGLTQLAASADVSAVWLTIALSVVATWLGWVAITELPKLHAARNPRTSR